MSTNVINFDTATKVINAAEFKAYITAKVHESNPQRWWIVTRKSDNLANHQFDLVFFRDLGDTLNQIEPEQQRHKMLVPLYQYLDYIEINSEHSDKLLSGFFNYAYIPLDVHHSPDVNLSFIHHYPTQQGFITEELTYFNFAPSDLVPFYMVNKHGELEREKNENKTYCDLYIEFEHIKFAELVFRAYSLLVECGAFARPEFLNEWQRYLELMQNNATADNLEELHRMYWLSYHPELANLSNTAKGVN